MTAFIWIFLNLILFCLFGIGMWVVKRNTRDTKDYLLSGGNNTRMNLGTAIFASNISSGRLTGSSDFDALTGTETAR